LEVLVPLGAYRCNLLPLEEFRERFILFVHEVLLDLLLELVIELHGRQHRLEHLEALLDLTFTLVALCLSDEICS